MLRVLLVDDDEPTRRIIAESLRQHRLQVFEAEHAQAADAALSEHVFDAVVSDHRLPLVSGAEFLVRVQQHIGIPCVLISAHDEITTGIKTATGEIVFLPKPVNGQHLADVIRGAVRTQAIEQAREAIPSRARPW